MKRRTLLTKIAEFTALFITFILPWKFGSIVSVPEFPASYETDLAGLIFMTTPIPVFVMLSCVLLIFATLAITANKEPLKPASPWLKGYVICWGLLAVTVFAGFCNASAPVYAFQMTGYTAGLASFTTAVYLLFRNRPEFIKPLATALLFGTALALFSGLYQHFIGFKALQQHIYEQNLNAGEEIIGGQLKNRIMELRVQGDFSVCNTYAGYLAMMLPLFAASLWCFGNERVEPEKLSRWVLSLPFLLVFCFLIYVSGSRGAIFSILAGGTVFLLFQKMPFKYRLGGSLLILAGLTGFLILVLTGRGFQSMFFRFDYDQAAFRMMLDNFFCGTGWGDFFHDYLRYKNLINNEAPHTPHNMILLFGSQTGIFPFLLSTALLALPCIAGLRYLLREPFKKMDLRIAAVILAVLTGVADSMLEISFETPAFAASLILLSLILLFQIETNRESKAASSSVNRNFCLLLLIPAVAIFAYAFWLARAENAADILQSTLDPRFSRETAMPAPPSREKLLRYLEDVVRIDPFNPFSYASAGDYFAATGDIEMAEKCYEECLKRAPERPAFYQRRARLNYMKNGGVMTEAILNDLACMRRLSPKNPEYDVPDEQLVKRQERNQQ